LAVVDTWGVAVYPMRWETAQFGQFRDAGWKNYISLTCLSKGRGSSVAWGFWRGTNYVVAARARGKRILLSGIGCGS